MPEGHVLHRLARDLGELAGRELAVPSPQGKLADQAALLDGARLWATVQAMMRRAVDDGRIVTVDPPAGQSRAEVPEEAARYVYQQEHCRRCGAAVESWTLGGRTAYACPAEQPAA